MIFAIRLVAVVALVVTSISCNRRDSPIDTPTTPTPPGSSEPRPGVSWITFQPTATYGPATVRGTVKLMFGAPTGGLEVALSSSDPTLLSLPSTVMVQAGKDSVEISGFAQEVTADRNITVTATAVVGREATTTFSLWTVLPTFFSFASEPGDFIGGGRVRKITPPYREFNAMCVGNAAIFTLRDQANLPWRAEFQAPNGLPLRVGTYEGATRPPSQRDSEPGLDISGEFHGCNRLTGRFTIREAEFSPSGQVRHFWATFEQHCEGLTPALYGDLRVTNGPAVSGGNCLQ